MFQGLPPPRLRRGPLLQSVSRIAASVTPHRAAFAKCFKDRRPRGPAEARPRLFTQNVSPDHSPARPALLRKAWWLRAPPHPPPRAAFVVFQGLPLPRLRRGTPLQSVSRIAAPAAPPRATFAKCFKARICKVFSCLSLSFLVSVFWFCSFLFVSFLFYSFLFCSVLFFYVLFFSVLLCSFSVLSCPHPTPSCPKSTERWIQSCAFKPSLCDPHDGGGRSETWSFVLTLPMPCKAVLGLAGPQVSVYETPAAQSCHN